MRMSKDQLISILAIFVLVLSISSTLYVNTNKAELMEENQIIVNGNLFFLSDFFENIEQKIIKIDGDEFTGIPLDKIIFYSGVVCGSCHVYTIKAVDPSPYQQTVQWENMQNGILTNCSRVYFPELARAFWVYNVIEIEVI